MARTDQKPSPTEADGGAGSAPAGLWGQTNMTPAGIAGQRNRWDEQDERALLALVRAYPVGADVHFRSFLPVLSSRWWRQRETSSTGGFHAGDALEVTGYGATQGVPDALLVRRGAGTPSVLVFPLELEPAAAPGTA
jgi:hypothetical protein